MAGDAPVLILDVAEPDPLRPRLFIDDLEIPVTSIEWTDRPVIHADFTAYYTQAYAEIGARMAPVVGQLVSTIKTAHEALIRFALAYGMPPCRFGGGPCFCHPKPFPAARDYRRRTKHRRRGNR